jgi:hypothetical protein
MEWPLAMLDFICGSEIQDGRQQRT